MTNAIIIISLAYEADVFGSAVLEQIGQRVNLVSRPMSREEAVLRPELLRDVEVLFCGWVPPVFDQDFLKMVPKLRLVLYAAGSIKNFVSNEMWRRGIRVSSAWVINGAAVAEYTLAAILFGLKQGFRYNANWRAARRYAREELPLGICDSTVAVLSLGASGRAVCELLKHFDVSVLAFDPYVSSTDAAQLGVELVSLDDAFRLAEVVSVHTPVTTETRGMIRGKHLRSMRHGATFINTARGIIVNEEEMIAVLAERTDLTAVLDVTEPEPPTAASQLFDLPNIYLTPHIAGALGRDCRRLALGMIEEFDRWKAGQPLNWEIKPTDLHLRG